MVIYNKNILRVNILTLSYKWLLQARGAVLRGYRGIRLENVSREY